MYLKFLYKDIFKRRFLFLLITFTILCVSLLSFEFYKVVKDQFKTPITYRLHVYKTADKLTQQDQDKLLQLLGKKELNRFTYTTLKTTKKVDVCEIAVLGAYPLEDNAIYSDDITVKTYEGHSVIYNAQLKDIFYHKLMTERLFMPNNNLEDLMQKNGCSNLLIYPLTHLDELLTDAEFGELVQNINVAKDDSTFEQDLENTKFQFVNANIVTRDVRENQKSILLVVALLLSFLISIAFIVLKVLFEYILKKMYTEYMIQMFYGASFLNIVFRNLYYFGAIFLAEIVMVNYIFDLKHVENKIQEMLVPLGVVFVVVMLFFGVFMTILYNKVFKKARNKKC